MVDVDRLESFDWENWKVGRKFKHIDSGEIVRYKGTEISPAKFETMVTFEGRDQLTLEYTIELFEDYRSCGYGFKKLEEDTSLRPLSIGRHNLLTKWERAEEEISKTMSEEIRKEIDKQVLEDIRKLTDSLK